LRYRVTEVFLLRRQQLKRAAIGSRFPAECGLTAGDGRERYVSARAVHQRQRELHRDPFRKFVATEQNQDGDSPGSDNLFSRHYRKSAKSRTIVLRIL
jgi:hypothetical protein